MGQSPADQSAAHELPEGGASTMAQESPLNVNRSEADGRSGEAHDHADQESPLALSASEAQTEALVAAKLKAATKAAQLGRWQRAHHLSVDATRLAPNSVEAWLCRAALAASSEERLVCLTEVLKRSPDHREARRGMYDAMNRYLKQRPFLRFLEETPEMYRIVTGSGEVVIVPKDRGPRSLPPNDPAVAQPAYRWLGLALLGLLLAGLGALVFAPVAAALAWRDSHTATTVEQRQRAKNALVYAGILWTTGLLLSFLFLLHL